MKKPDGHTLYWVYAWNEPETEYNFETTTQFKEAQRLARAFISDDGFHHAYVMFGNQDGQFTQYDPADQFWPKESQKT
jgi:hypothetical protein